MSEKLAEWSLQSFQLIFIERRPIGRKKAPSRTPPLPRSYSLRSLKHTSYSPTWGKLWQMHRYTPPAITGITDPPSMLARCPQAAMSRLEVHSSAYPDSKRSGLKLFSNESSAHSRLLLFVANSR